MSLFNKFIFVWVLSIKWKGGQIELASFLIRTAAPSRAHMSYSFGQVGAMDKQICGDTFPKCLSFKIFKLTS
jgi:hypothetical protein